MKGRVEQLMDFFEYNHLPSHLKELSKPCADLADHMIGKFAQSVVHPNDNEELIAGLRKLLEAKDCFVRALITVTHP
jgi:hypothetical protein